MRVGKEFHFDIPGTEEALSKYCGRMNGKGKCFNAAGFNAFF